MQRIANHRWHGRRGQRLVDRGFRGGHRDDDALDWVAGEMFRGLSFDLLGKLQQSKFQPGKVRVHARQRDRPESGKDRLDLGDLYAESGQTLQGSFSAVSKPNFASKYSLESSRRDLRTAFFLTNNNLVARIMNFPKK